MAISAYPRFEHFNRTLLVLLGCFSFLSAKTIVVNNQALDAKDSHPGTEAQPLKTIQAAAMLAQPGDVVLEKPVMSGKLWFQKPCSATSTPIVTLFTATGQMRLT